MVTKRVRVLLLDSEAMVCQAMASMLSASGWINVVGQFVDTDSLHDRLQALQPDLLLLKAGMCNCDPVPVVRAVHERFPRIKLVLLIDPYRETEREIDAAIEAGVRAILSRALELDDLLSCIRIVMSGGVVVATALASRVIDAKWSAARPSGTPSVWDNRAIPMALANTGLSEREFDVLTLLAEGASNRQIAELLCITENTAKTHVRNILEKLQLQSRTHAAAFAIRRGFVRPASEEEEPERGREKEKERTPAGRK